MEIRVNEDYPKGSGRSLTYTVNTDKPKKGFKVLLKLLKKRKKEVDEAIKNAKM